MIHHLANQLATKYHTVTHTLGVAMETGGVAMETGGVAMEKGLTV